MGSSTFTAAPVLGDVIQGPAIGVVNQFQFLLAHRLGTLDLAIVAPAEFVPALARLREHKQYTGMRTEIFALEDIYANIPGRDEAERVKRFLADRRAKNQVHYALLVGDCDKFPVRYTTYNRGDTRAADFAFFPADLYYADLFKDDGSFADWDFNGDGYFGELHGETLTGEMNIDRVDLRPDIAVGRIPASTLGEVETYVDKIITFEFNAYKSPWTQRAMLIATTNWIVDACKTQEDIAANYLNGWQIYKLYEAGNPCCGTLAPTPVQVNTLLDNGVKLVSFIGHGRSDCWWGVWGIKEAVQLHNENSPAIMFAAACDTGKFTTDPPYGPYKDVSGNNHAGSAAGELFTCKPPQPACIQADTPESLGEVATVKIKGGAVAYLACATGSQEWGRDLNRFFFESLKYGATKLGDMWKHMLTRYYQVHIIPATLPTPEWYKLAEIHQPWKYILFGDPSLRISGVSRFQKADFLGVWDMVHDGWKGTLELVAADDSFIDPLPNVRGKYTGADGKVYAVTGKVRTPEYPLDESWGPDYQIVFKVDFPDLPNPDIDAQFQGLLFTQSRDAMAGFTKWAGRPFSFYAMKKT